MALSRKRRINCITTILPLIKNSSPCFHGARLLHAEDLYSNVLDPENNHLAFLTENVKF